MILPSNSEQLGLSCQFEICTQICNIPTFFQTARLSHSECVNCVVICPSDEEVCVTASDDRTLSVWTSRRRIRNDPELTELKQDEI
jgi:WD40 repeat protein